MAHGSWIFEMIALALLTIYLIGVLLETLYLAWLTGPYFSFRFVKIAL